MFNTIYESPGLLFRKVCKADPYSTTSTLRHASPWSQMRHSSWTLFLVPLAIPLVFLCLPGSMKSTDRSGPSEGEAYESLLEEDPSSLDATEFSLAFGESFTLEIPEALFRD